MKGINKSKIEKEYRRYLQMAVFRPIDDGIDYRDLTFEEYKIIKAQKNK